MSISSPQRNPIRETEIEGHLTAEKEIINELLSNYKKVISKTNYLHANLLFTTQYGRFMLNDICRFVTYIEPSMTKNSWKDLAVRLLGYDDVKIKCLSNLKGEIYDPTELILQYYANNPFSTIEDILLALLYLEFYPALKQAQIYIDELIAEVKRKEVNTIQAPTNTKEPLTKKIVKDPSFNPYVPKIFDISQVNESFANLDKQYSNITAEKIVLTSRSQSMKKSQKNVASVLRGTLNKNNLPIGVLMLHENENQIQENPAQQISYVISKMDFVIPVLTEGYFTALKYPNIKANLLDDRYVQYVYNILLSKYISNQCLNFNVRPIIPKESIDSIAQKEEFIHNALFNASWKSCDQIQNIADSIVKTCRKKV